MNALIRLLYSLLIAGTVVAFAGLTVYSFYQPPDKDLKEPKYNCTYPSNYDPVAEASYNKCDEEYSQRLKAHWDKEEKIEDNYQRNVTYMLLPMALLSAAAGVFLVRRRSEVIGEGLALGAAAISIYAIITSSIADARILRFLSALLLLTVVIVLAHFRFRDKK